MASLIRLLVYKEDTYQAVVPNTQHTKNIFPRQNRKKTIFAKLIGITSMLCSAVGSCHQVTQIGLWPLPESPEGIASLVATGSEGLDCPLEGKSGQLYLAARKTRKFARYEPPYMCYPFGMCMPECGEMSTNRVSGCQWCGLVTQASRTSNTQPPLAHDSSRLLAQTVIIHIAEHKCNWMHTSENQTKTAMSDSIWVLVGFV